MFDRDLRESVLITGLALSFLIGSAFADSNPSIPKRCVNPSARCYEDTGFDITAAFLWWKSEQPDLPYAFVNTSDTYQEVGFLEYINFSWNPGFRVEACWETNYEGWNLSADYTWMRNESKAHCSKVTDPEYGLFQLNDYRGVHYPYLLFGTNNVTHESFILNLGFGSCSAKWEMHYNMFNLQLSKPYLVSRNLALTPFVGAQGGWIKRDLDVILSNQPFDLTQQQNDATSNYWGVGPRLGFNSEWKVGCGFEFFGNLASALLYGAAYDEKITSITTSGGAVIDSSTLVTDIFKKHNETRLVPAIQMMLGVGWSDCFNWSRHDYFVDIRASWEMNYYWNMENFLSPQGIQAAYVFPTNLKLGGLTASATFGF